MIFEGVRSSRFRRWLGGRGLAMLLPAALVVLAPAALASTAQDATTRLTVTTTTDELTNWPPFRGSGCPGVGCRFQGGTTTENLYIGGVDTYHLGVWQGYCDLGVKTGSGRFVGFYVDDTVSLNASPPHHPPAIASGQSWANEANCVYWDHRYYPGYMVIAAIPGPARTWSFAQWGGINAQEWYPVCGSSFITSRPAGRVHWIAQWNYAHAGCGTNSRTAINNAVNQILSTHPSLVLYF